VTLLALCRCLELLLALILLFEEWGWRPLADLLGRLRRFPAWERLETAIANLPPYAALCVFAVPPALIFPAKLLAIYLIANGRFVLAGALFVAAKVIGTAIVARIFVLTHPKLMQIGWFARGYNWILPWQESLFAAIRATWAWRYGRVLRGEAKAAVRHSWRRLQPLLLSVRADGAAMFRRLAGSSVEGIRDAWRKFRMRYTP
jgi:hypothetical protein